MRLTLLALSAFMAAAMAQDTAAEARRLEAAGDVAGARTLLEDAARQASADTGRLTELAEFLDRRRDPATRQAYERLLAALKRSGSRERQAAVARRLIMLDLIGGDRAAATRHIDEYRSVGGPEVTLPPAPAANAQADGYSTVELPGPLRSFARMAALSPDLSADDLLPALARNVVTNGYQASSSNEALDQTEYLKLVVRYLSQARELSKLAGPAKQLNIETCESTLTGDLLRVLGYRMRGGCGADVVLETVNATRAFLTIDSGFPLAELEQALRTNRPFKYDYQTTLIPILYGAEYWLSSRERQSGEFIDAFLADPALCRLYLGLAKLDRDTAEELRKTVSVQRIKAFAHVLDFFGGMLQIRGGKVVVPGEPRATAMWTELVGAPPDQGAKFLENLISKDDGWLASYFDALSRIHGPVKDYLTQPERLKRFYLAVRGRVTSPGPARPVFRSNTDMMLLTSRLRLDQEGRPHIPGGIDVWKNLFALHPHGKYDGKLTRAAAGWKDPDDVLEALFGLCRKAVENEPLKMFMALSDVNRRRTKPLESATVERMIRDYRNFGAQYTLFAEVPSLSDATIIASLDLMVNVSLVRDPAVRANAAGVTQALLGLWQIFCRQETIAPAQADAVLSGIVTGFGKVKSLRELFDVSRTGVLALLAATGAPQGTNVHDRMIDLLAGGSRPSESEARTQMVQEMVRIFETQRLISLKTILDLSDHLDAVGKGEKLNTALVNRMASRINEIQLPRTALSGVEKNAFSFGYWTERHVESQRRFNVKASLERAGSDPEKLREIRGQLVPFLRDTLVGYNYLHYAPPGAQILYTNPLFVRGHDFLGVQGSPQTWKTTEVFGTGWPSSAGGRLVGSLAGLPYALAEAEQNFLVPSREQALIWGDLVPQMILSAKVPRWWSITPSQLHWVGLHMRLAESLIAESAIDPALRTTTLELLDRQAPPARARRVEKLISGVRVDEALDHVTPSEAFALAAGYVAANRNAGGPFATEIRRLAAESPQRNSYAAISSAFGTPKPTLTHSYQPELLHLRTFPTLMGYSSRIMAESWESSLLFYAALADEISLPPAQLNVAIPEWTQKTVERIFATHLEDWPALLKSLRRVGEDVREQRLKGAVERKASLE